jgi:2-oxo-4-hydroxy-4-carboxy-5-ureidoimidazoline decarboxylase
VSPEPHALLDELPPADARVALERCCGARRWVDGMLQRRPFGSREALLRAADEIWSACDRDDYLEAFAHHPRIGTDPAALRARFAATAQWSAAEQAGAVQADDATLARLQELNAAYAARFGFIFIVCATGKSAAEMLALLEVRSGNEPRLELAIAAAEQAKITRLRLEKLGT